MKYLYFILIIVSLVSGQTLNHIGAPGGTSYSIFLNRSNSAIVYCAVVGEGSVYASYDKGVSTVPILHEFSENPYTVYGMGAGENEKIYIDAHYLGIQRSDDHGKTWLKIAENNVGGNVTNPFILNPLQPDILYTIQNDKDLMYSSDFGDTWTHKFTFDKDIYVISISQIDTSILYAAADHAVYKSINSGKEWQKFDITLPYGWRPFKLKTNPQNKNSLFLVVSGSLLKMSSRGKIDTLYSGDVNDFDICSTDSNTIYLAFGDPVFYQGGGLLKSENGGESWQDIKIDLPNFHICNTVTIDPNNPDIVYALFGPYYGVFRSEDAGENWVLTNLVHATPLNFFPLNNKPGEILTIQFFWNMLKTNTYGQSWFYPQFTPAVSYWGSVIKNSLSINPANSNIAYYAAKSDLYKTVDGGNSWSATGELRYPALVQYHDYNAEIIWTMLDSSYDQYLSMNGGDSWERIYNGQTEFPITGPGQFRFNKKEPRLVYASGYRKFEYYIVKSRDYFKTWEAFNDGLPRHPETHKVRDILAFEVNPLDPSVLYIALKDYGLMRSNDSGYTWLRIDSALSELCWTGRINDILLDDNDTSKIYVSINRYGQALTDNFVSGGLYVSSNSGKSWKEVYHGETNDIRRDNAEPPNIYFSTPYGIWMINDSVATGIESQPHSMPELFSLQQNYPNPFNPQTTIKYSVAIPGKVTLKIYDIGGREVAALVDKEQSSGNYTVIFNGRKLASGVYIYRLVQNGHSLQRKMLLVK